MRTDRDTMNDARQENDFRTITWSFKNAGRAGEVDQQHIIAAVTIQSIPGASIRQSP